MEGVDYKQLWLRQQVEFIKLESHYNMVVARLEKEVADNKAAHQQLAFALRERDLCAGALAKTRAAYDALLARFQ
jgi:hypothetical protein